MRRILRILVLAILAFLIAFPLFYLFSLSLFSPRDFLSDKAQFFPKKANWSNFVLALSYRYLPVQLFNSISTSTLLSTIRFLVITLASFSFTHFSFKGKKAIFIGLMATLFVPQDALLYQNYKIISSLGLIDTYLGIIAPSLFSASQMILLIGAFSHVDKNCYDSARIDGASDRTYITQVLLPLSKSIVLVILLQAFISCFNSYLWPLLVTNKPRTRTIQIGLTMLGFAEEGNYGAEMASLLIVVLPFVVLISICKKSIEKALIESSIYK